MLRKLIRVIVIDDHEVVRSGLSSLLSREPDMRVVGAFESAEDAIERISTLAPDVIVLDHRLGATSGAIVCGEIMRSHPERAVLMLTGSTDGDVLIACLMAGARGFLLKNAASNDLVSGVRAIAEGRPAMTPEALDTLLAWVRRQQPECKASDQLHPQEIAALSLAAQGLKNKEIACRLHVSQSAVRTYLSGARRKLGAHERSEAVLVGIRRGVI